MISGAAILGAYFLDQLFGDPHFRLHPVCLIGAVAEFWRKRLYALGKLGGLLTLLGTVFVFELLVLGASRLGPFMEVVILYFYLAEKALREEALKVYQALVRKDLFQARRVLSFIVGRETKGLSSAQCVRATIETVAENFTDAVVGPLFYYVVGGLPLATFYKVVETLDSMYGYKTKKWREFGFFIARADDLLNFLPARGAMFFLVLAALFLGMPFRRAFYTAVREARKHDSPNAGWPEAAVAGALGIQLGGQVIYQGEVFQKGTLGQALRSLEPLDIKRAVALLRVATCGVVLFFCLVEVFLWKLGYLH